MLGACGGELDRGGKWGFGVWLWNFQSGKVKRNLGKSLSEAIFVTSASSSCKIMDTATQSAESLRKQIATTEEALKRLKEQLASVEVHQRSSEDAGKLLGGLSLREPSPVTKGKWPLSAEE